MSTTTVPLTSPSIAVLAAVALFVAGCVQAPNDFDLIPGAQVGCPSELSEQWQPEQTLAQTTWDLMVLQTCISLDDGIYQRIRDSGHGDWNDFVDDLETYLEGTEVQTSVVDWYDKKDTIHGGRAPVPPLRAEDLDGVRIPVLLFSLEGPTGEGTRYAFSTNIESLENSPRSPQRSHAIPSPSTDLSASGLAALLAAMIHTENPQHDIDVYAFSGELGYRGWTGVSFNPFTDAHPNTWEAYGLLLNVQNVGACPLEIQPSHFMTRRDSTMAILEHLQPKADSYGITISSEYATSVGQGVGDYGIHINPAKVVPGHGTPAASLDGGWWAGKSEAGTVDDDLDTVCRSGVSQFSSFLMDVMDDLGSIPQERVPDCERQFPIEC